MPMSCRANARLARHRRLPRLRHRDAFLKTSQPGLIRTIKRIEDVIGLHRGINTLPAIGPMLLRNRGVITLKEREPTPSLGAHPRGTDRIDARQGIINGIMISLAWVDRRPISARTEWEREKADQETSMASLNDRDNTANRLTAARAMGGLTVFSIALDELGRIEDVIIEGLAGRIAFAIPPQGGILGIGAHHYPLRRELLRYD